MAAPLRRWVPPRAVPVLPEARSSASPAGSKARPLRPDQVPARDLAFCAEFAVHGGLARSATGFKGEADLLRMQQSGLLDLERDPAPPFNVVEVRLSVAAQSLLSAPSKDAQAAMGPKPGVVAAKPADAARPVAGNVGTERRSGFEIARGMIGAAVKAEIAAWTEQGGPGGPGALESRLTARILQLNAPFPA